MKTEAFVIGDVHGMDQTLERLLSYWNPEEQQLIFVGDLIDRGPQSAKVIQRVRELQQTHGAICLCGNHEDMLRETLEQPEEFFERYARNGGLTTIAELLETRVAAIEALTGQALANQLSARHGWLEPWLNDLPLYTEFGQFLIVHAGVNPEVSHWRYSSRRDFVWIREPFHSLPNQTGRPIIFGHTPVKKLYGSDDIPGIWQREGGLYGIDGGAVYGGVLFAVRINQEALLDVYCVPVLEERIIK